MPNFMFSLSAQPPKPKPKKPGETKVVVRAGGRGGAGNITRVKELATPPSPNGLSLVRSNNIIATTETARTSATHNNSAGSQAKSLSTLPEERVTHPDYGDNIILPTGREVGLPHNKTTTSGRGGAGNAHNHVLEKGVFERVIAYEDAVILPYRKAQALKISRTTGRGGAGNMGHSKDNLNKDGSSSRRSCGSSLMIRRTRSCSIRTKSSGTKSRELTRVETQRSMHTTETNVAPLSSPSFSDQTPETPQEERRTDNNHGLEAEEAELELELGEMLVPNGRQGSASRPKGPEMQDTGYSSSDRWTPFRPSPESWTNTTTGAFLHLRMTGPIPRVPHTTLTPSLPNVRVAPPSSASPSRVVEAQVEISASLRFEQALPRVSRCPHGPTERTSLTPPSKQFQSQKLRKPVRLPESRSPALPNGSIEPPPRQTREKKQRNRNKNITICSSISNDYLVGREDDSEQKPAPFIVPARPYLVESLAKSTTGQIDPLDPIPSSIGGVSPYTSRLSTARINERHGPLTSHDTAPDITGYVSPDAPSHTPVHLPPASQHTRQKRRGAVVDIDSRVRQLRRDDYRLDSPPYGTTQSLGIGSVAALHRSPKIQAGRDFPRAPRDDIWAYGVSSSPAPGLSSVMTSSYIP